MSNIELRFERPWLLLLLLPAVALILVPWLRMPKKRRKLPQRMIPMIVHCVLALLMVTLLSGFSVVRSTDNQAIIVLVDTSASTDSTRETLENYADDLQKQLRKHASVERMTFGDDATDIAQALEKASNALPDGKVGRIVVISDGRQTDGDAAATAQYLHSQGVRVDTVWVDTSTTGREAQIADFTAPESVFVGQTAVLTATVESNSKSTMIVTAYEGDREIYSRQLTVDDAGTVLTIEVPVESPGVHNYSLVMQADQDTKTENNAAVTSLLAVEKPKALLLTGVGTDSAPLQQLLQEHYALTVQDTSKPIRKITQLCDFDAVILMDVHADDMPKNFGNLLDRYVSEYGRSLIALGGTQTFMYGAMRGTVYEQMMPVNFNLSRADEGDSVALMLVMDCSLSMSQQSTYMSVAKQGAIKCVEGMTENDYVGLISFNQEASMEAHLARNTQANKDSLNRIISGLTTSKGTYYTDALTMALQELSGSDADIRHVLFVSDGGPADTEYTKLFPSFAEAGITVSTVALGHESTVLEDMANNCGGTYYFVQESTELPNIMLSLTQQVTVNSLLTGLFQPQQVAESPVQFTTLPEISGYLGTTLKRGADAHLTVEDGNPLLASWNWGAGKVTCFTSDFEPNWCANWLRSDLVERLFDSAMPTTHGESALQITAKPGVHSVDVQVRTADTADYLLYLHSGEMETQLVCAAPGIYTGTVPVTGMGSYSITVTQTDLQGQLVDRCDYLVSVPIAREHDVFADSGKELMKSVALYGGGMAGGTAADLAAVTAEAISSVLDLRVPFGIAFAAALLVDIGIRKLRWKDFKNLWLSLIRKK